MKTKKTDPAYRLLEEPGVYSIPDESIFRQDCYICTDPEYSLMGLPLCYRCHACNGHVPADDVVCSDCGCHVDDDPTWGK